MSKGYIIFNNCVLDQLRLREILSLLGRSESKDRLRRKWFDGQSQAEQRAIFIQITALCVWESIRERITTSTLITERV